MKIKQNDNGKRGGFFIEQESRTVAKMTYSWAGESRIIIDHTEVDASLKGKGVGKQLVAQAVLFARERNIKILPLCPFARSVFEKMSEYQDVL
ncbi:GNAT family N-acetyltransferase [Pontibacter sp. 13R65]|uniref:GNAT family N-acetyltransferase n=1 Tax=Pontibacter sp. 13R65 TaxID=3127458 RepID=UPI00301B71D0